MGARKLPSRLATEVSEDIRPILSGWPHKPGEISVRKITGDDGKTKMQLRLDLGLLQMETEGRPDGKRPHGCESLLEYLKQELRRHRDAHDGDDRGFAVDEKHCDLLRGEAVQYYYRYLGEFVLEDYEAVRRDTQRNLEVLDFCARHAEEEPDRYLMEQYRPYILMMNTRATARLALRDSRPRAAREVVKRALERLREYYGRFGQEDLYGSSTEVATLEAMLKDIDAKVTNDPLGRLRRDLARAVEEERYEDAARIRDAIEAAGAEEA